MTERHAGERGYQVEWSKEHPEILDRAFRARKARKILAVLREVLEGRDLSSLRVLDVGASIGRSFDRRGRHHP